MARKRLLGGKRRGDSPNLIFLKIDMGMNVKIRIFLGATTNSRTKKKGTAGYEISAANFSGPPQEPRVFGKARVPVIDHDDEAAEVREADSKAVSVAPLVLWTFLGVGHWEG